MTLNSFSSQSPPAIRKAKHVTFALNPVICKSIPWKINSFNSESQFFNEETLDNEETDLSLSFTPLSSYSDEPDLKSLKVPYHINKEHPNIIGLIIIIICLISLFILIWWIADKLLILEIEKQISNNPIGFSNNSK